MSVCPWSITPSRRRRECEQPSSREPTIRAHNSTKQAEMFAATALARTAARRAATATPARLGALRAMSSETATFDLTGSFEVRRPRRKNNAAAEEE